MFENVVALMSEEAYWRLTPITASSPLQLS